MSALVDDALLAAGPVPTPVLMYHRIAHEASPAMRRFTVSPEDFAWQLDCLRDAGFSALSVSQWVHLGRDAPERLPRQPVVLSFDDGYLDFEQHALPLLQASGWPATLYVVAGRVGQCSDWLPGDDARLPLLGWPALARLQQAGIEIGAHGMSHLALDGLDDIRLQWEVEQPRRVMTCELGQVPESFCYPFGFCDARVRDAVRRAGYASACAVRYATAQTGDDPFFIARHIVPAGLDRAGFAALLAPRTPLARVWRDRLRSRAGAAWRQARHAWKT